MANTVKFAAETAATIVLFYARPTAGLPYLGLGAISDPHLLQTQNAALDDVAASVLNDAAAQAAAAGVAFRTLSQTGDQPWALIVEAAEQEGCDAIFMASHGRRGVSGILLGSETQKVLTHSQIPVLVYR
ncbi:universal stress protein [Thalassolituus sp. LLYu03]|uniref:universal stress protein n=1 Tax=Thalassolituus sp. LLYu03 TaxID=3421656 RepID=UPI003D2D18BB